MAVGEQSRQLGGYIFNKNAKQGEKTAGGVSL